MSEATQPLVTGVAVVAVYVTDLERARAFYEGVLGLKPGGEMSPGVLLEAGSATVYLEGGRERRAGAGMKGATTSMALLAPSVRAAWERLQAAGAPVVQAYSQDAPTFAMFRVEDPDGNVIEIVGAP